MFLGFLVVVLKEVEDDIDIEVYVIDDGEVVMVIIIDEGDYLFFVSLFGSVNGLIVGIIEDGWGVVV